MKKSIVIIFLMIGVSIAYSQDFKFENENKYDLVNFWDKGIISTRSNGNEYELYFSTKIFTDAYKRFYNKYFSDEEINSLFSIDIAQEKFVSAQRLSSIHIIMNNNRFSFRKNANNIFMLTSIYLKNNDFKIFYNIEIGMKKSEIQKILGLPNYYRFDCDIYRLKLQDIVFIYQEDVLIEIQYNFSDGL